MTTYRAAFFLCCVIITLAVIGLTAERLAARLAWVGAAMLMATVGCWMVL
jgi:hypothetical protein